MNFDIMIGNPPYNNSTDYKFIMMGIKMNIDLISILHPARWKVANNEEAEQIREIFINKRKLSDINIFEAGHSGVTSIWSEALTQSINYWLYHKNKSFDNLRVYTEMSNKNIKYSGNTIRKHKEKEFDFFVMNGIVLEIIKKQSEQAKKCNIAQRFEILQNSKVWIANSLQAIYTRENKTSDCKNIDIPLEEVKIYALFVKTQFWRALVRQCMSGFHSYNINALKYIADLSEDDKDKIKGMNTVEELEEYLENKFNLSHIEIDYLKNYGITDSP